MKSFTNVSFNAQIDFFCPTCVARGYHRRTVIPLSEVNIEIVTNIKAANIVNAYVTITVDKCSACGETHVISRE
jgi:hypothetical protein